MLFAAAGHQAEAALKQAMRTNAGKYVCVVEGAIPTKENGIYCMIGGRTALDIVQGVAGQAGAVIAIGSCASWGGIPSADPNPDGCRRRARGPQGQDGGQHPRLLGQSCSAPPLAVEANRRPPRALWRTAGRRARPVAAQPWWLRERNAA